MLQKYCYKSLSDIETGMENEMKLESVNGNVVWQLYSKHRNANSRLKQLLAQDLFRKFRLCFFLL